MLLRGVLTLAALVAAASESTATAALASAKKRPALLALRGGAAISKVEFKAVPGATEREKVIPLPEVDVHNIAKFQNWDHQECCVGNAQQWRDYMGEFLKRPKDDIPKKIHQIWIGPKQPPIIWCDSWRKRYRSEYPGWEYKLWTDAEVSKLNLRTRQFYDKESMFQCKADLLRLEILWEEGGIYIDADMVWLHKDLQHVLDAGKATGFFCGYEPDTKDKPYSVIGNSFIACTPRHPLVDMLIKYIKAIYDHKRPYHGVEWVTGPLAFTKCISHTQMPFFVPPQIWFYPKFHYVPNPDAINLNDFPESYAFQFGYTCSGLEGWVANSINRISVDHFWIEKCPQLRGRHWPMGQIKEMPITLADTTGDTGDIPKVIHQFAFTGSKPEHLIKTWAENFCAANEGWTYRCHSWFPDLKGDYFGCSMYSPDPWAMGPLIMELFALEVLYNQGGYHVPLAVPWADKSSILALADSNTAPIIRPNLDPCEKGSPFSQKNVEAGFVELEELGIVGASAGSGQLLKKIKTLLGKSEFPMTCKDVYPRMLVPMDSQTSYLDFPDWSRCLGAEMIFDLGGSDQTERDAFWLASTFMVPAYGLPRKNFASLKGVEGRFMAVTDPDLYRYRSLSDAVPGFITEMDTLHGATGWHFICLVLQWKAGADAPVLDQVKHDGIPGDARFVGLVANRGAGALLPDLAEQPKVYEDFVEVWRSILKMHDTKKLGTAFRKFQWAADDERASSSN